MQIWDNPASYKRCSKKLYEIHACMPPVGTVVVNILEQADVVQLLGGRTYFTAAEVIQLKNQGNPLFTTLQQLAQQGRIYTVNETKNVVLAGTMGEMWVVDFGKLTRSYTNINGSPIDARQLSSWHKIKTVPDKSYAYACFVPNNTKGQIATAWGSVLNINGVGVEHGLGDFVIAANGLGGNPNMADRYVVNGIIFGRTYNNNGFTKYLKPEKSNWSGITIDKLPKLCITSKSRNELDVVCRAIKAYGGDTADVIAFKKIVTNKAYQSNMQMSQDMLVHNFYSFLCILHEVKKNNHTLKLSFPRMSDSANCNVDDYMLAIDYDINYNGRSLYGYLNFYPKYVNFATWNCARNEDDPDESVVNYGSFSTGWFINHISGVR